MKNMLISTYVTGEHDCGFLPTVSSIFWLSFVPWTSYQVPGTWLPGMKTFSFFFVPSFLQVSLYLYISLHTLFTRTYVVHIQQHRGTRWYEPVIPVASGAIRGHYDQGPWFQNGFGRGQRCMERINRGLHRRHKGRNWSSAGGVRGPNLDAQTHQYTREEIVINLNNGTLWANVLGIFSQARAHSWPLITERCGRFAPTSAPQYKKGWAWGAWQTPSSGQTSNCVSYWVGSSYTFFVLQHSFQVCFQC